LFHFFKSKMTVTSLSWLLLTLVTSHSLEERMEERMHPMPIFAERINSEGSKFWMKSGEESLKLSLAMRYNTGTAKNIVLFIGDGMSIPTVTAARIYKGQKNLNHPDGSDPGNISWEKFPYLGLSKTACADYLIPDSAATATAMFTGQKANFYTLGYNGSAKHREPSTARAEYAPETILDWAQAAGMKTGFVTTTRMTHATPAALYAKSVDRFWEGDRNIYKSISKNQVTEEEIKENNVQDISLQLVESKAGRNLAIMLGGGRSSFLPKKEEDGLLRFDYANERDEWDNYRMDGQNLIEKWKKYHPEGKYITNRTELLDEDLIDEASHVMGIFTNSYMLWDDMVNATNDKPRLHEMASTAVKFLKAKAGDAGFFIMIEAGRIDGAHHNGQAKRALMETLAFDKAVEEVMELVDLKETLMIVTADHSHTMSIGGYVPRDMDITGAIKQGEFKFTPLSYANGPGFMKLESRGPGDYSSIDRGDLIPDFNQRLGDGFGLNKRYLPASAAPLTEETHGGDDVGVWSVGPWSHLLRGTFNQTWIHYVMSYSACVAPHHAHSYREKCVRGAGVTVAPNYIVVLVLVSIIVYYEHQVE